MKKASIIISALILMILVSDKAFAHKINVYAYEDGSLIHLQSSFASGKPCANCQVEVFEADSKTMLMKGKTDNKGELTFEHIGEKALKLVTRAGGGHKGEFKLLLDLDRLDTHTSASDFDHDHTETDMNAQCMELIDEKHQVAMNEIIKLREAIERPGLTEILGGIGYIIGIFGFIMYLKTRKTPK